MANRIAWAANGDEAYLYDANGQLIGRWFRNRPELNTFDPFTYGGGLETYGAYGGTPAGGAGQAGYVYDTGGDGGGGGYYQDPDRLDFDEMCREYNLDWQQRQDAAAEAHRQFDERLAFDRQQLEQQLRQIQMEIASSEGMQRERLAAELQRLQMEIESNERIANLDRASREKIAEADIVQRVREMQSKERITAAETWANPIDTDAYLRWMSGQQAMTTESGLPVGAPGWDTGLPGATPGQPETATVGTGAVATGQGNVYGKQLAAGGRIQEFGAWGGPTTPVFGTPWTAPHQVNLTQFANSPYSAQQRLYSDWRTRGLYPQDVNQAMVAAAPTGTAKSVTAYG
jgi:hypothetical protein